MGNTLVVPLPNVVSLPLPKDRIEQMKFIQGKLWLGRLVCDTGSDGVTPVVTVKSWLGILWAMQYDLDLSGVLPELERAAQCKDHEEVINLIRSFMRA